MTTIQFDFNEPERFDMYYVGEDGQRHRPYMVHRALLGSIERFVGILTEHYAGKFPLWISPVQAMLINVSEEQVPFINTMKANMIEMGYRPQADTRNESMGYKIREAISQKVPYICVVGKNEAENGTVSVRRRGEKDSATMALDDFYRMLDREIAEKL